MKNTYLKMKNISKTQNTKLKTEKH